MRPWLRYYVEALDDPKVQGLPPDLFKHWINILCIAGKNDGPLPSAEVVAFGLRVSDAKAADIVSKLVTRELLDPVDGGYYQPHNWDQRQYKSDVSTERSRKHRQKQHSKGAGKVASNVAGNGDATLHETHQSRADQNRADQNGGGVVAREARTPAKKLDGVTAKEKAHPLAGPLFKKFSEAYRGPCGKAAEREFRALILAGENADPIIAAAHHASPEMPAEQWLAERAWMQLPLLPDADKSPIITPEATALAQEIVKIAGQNWDVLEPGWCAAAYRCQQWLKNGWPRALIVSGVQSMVAAKASEKINSVAYFERGLARFIAQHTRPVPQVIEHQAETVEVRRASGRDDSRSGVAAIGRVYAKLRAAAESQHGGGGDVPEPPVQRLPA
jgi:hypothetical protein